MVDCIFENTMSSMLKNGFIHQDEVFKYRQQLVDEYFHFEGMFHKNEFVRLYTLLRTNSNVLHRTMFCMKFGLDPIKVKNNTIKTILQGLKKESLE
jgi:hypothetical protein